jgi:hypothetical protein
MADPARSERAKEIAETFINGNRSDAVRAVAEAGGNLDSAALALEVLSEIAASKPDTMYVTCLTDFWQAIDQRR